MAGQNITTSIDDLVKYLNEHGETESSDLAKALKVNESIIETWADVLEKAKITKISYKVGKMYVSLPVAGAAGVETVKKTAELKRGIADTDLQAQITVINQVSAKIEQFKRYVTGAEATFKSKAGEIKGTLEEIDKLEAQINGAYKKLSDKKEHVDGMVSALDKSIGDLEKKSSSLAQVGPAGDTRALITDIRSKLENADAMITDLDKEFNKAVEENKRNFLELKESMKGESAALRRALFQHEKERDEYEAMAKSYERELERIRRQVSGEKEKMLDEITKTSYEVGKVYSVADGQLGTLRKSLDAMKSQFGGFADLSDKINKVKGEIGDVEKQRDGLAKELGDLSIQLKALAALEETNPVSGNVAAAEIDDKVAASGEKISELGESMESIRKDIEDIGR
jgi:chromosome segregation ATPase